MGAGLGVEVGPPVSALREGRRWLECQEGLLPASDPFPMAVAIQVVVRCHRQCEEACCLRETSVCDQTEVGPESQQPQMATWGQSPPWLGGTAFNNRVQGPSPGHLPWRSAGCVVGLWGGGGGP